MNELNSIAYCTMPELDSLVYWISTVERIHAINIVLIPALLLIFGVFLFILGNLGSDDITDAAKGFVMRWLWLLVVLQALNLCAIVFIPSQKELAILAKQRIYELNATVSPKVEEYIDSCIESCRDREIE